MARAKEKTLSMLASVENCDLNAAADTEGVLYATPTGKKMEPAMVILHSFSAGCSAAVITFGKSGGSCDEFLGNQTLTNISAAGDFCTCMPIPSATPAKGVTFDAGDEFAYEITTAEGSALTCTMELIGKERDA